MSRQIYAYITTVKVPEELTIGDWKSALDKVRVVGSVGVEDIENNTIQIEITDSHLWDLAMTVWGLSIELMAIGLPLLDVSRDRVRVVVT